MPIIEYGEKLNLSTSRFTKLKAKGDKIHFRLIGAPFFEGKHFLKDAEGNWDIKECSRINEDKECEYCIKFFKAHAKAKKEGLDQKETFKLTDPWKPSVSFYFPVINRETESFEVFQTTQSVRNKIEDELALGTKIMDRDLVVMRTEKPGSDYYALSVVDSADTKPLTKLEEAEIEKSSGVDLSEYVHGRAEEDSDIAIEANTEVEDDIDF